MNCLFLVVILYAGFRSVRGNFRMYNSFRKLLAINEKLSHIPDVNNKTKIYILIPVLREQSIIGDTFEVFANLKGKYELVFITTEKEKIENEKIYKKIGNKVDTIARIKNKDDLLEKVSGYLYTNVAEELYRKLITVDNIETRKRLILESFYKQESTIDILDRLVGDANKDNIRVLHYPDKEGVMSHQLNYACQYIDDLEKDNDPYIAVYNADSFVSQNHIQNIRRYIQAYPSAGIIQQSSLFLSNYDNFPNSFRGNLLKVIALLQSRWTLSHELPRIFSQSKKGISEYFEAAHVVGHGLIVKLSILKSVGYFPSMFANEDLPLGYFMRLKGYKIYPFHILENSESPRTFKSSVRQYRTWIYGPLYYFKYLQTAFHTRSVSLVKASFWALKYYIRGIMWILSSFVWGYLFGYSIMILSLEKLLAVGLIFFVYAPLNFIILNTLLRKYSKKLMPLSGVELNLPKNLYFYSFVIYLSHSYGPLLGMIDVVKQEFFGKDFYKGKTER